MKLGIIISQAEPEAVWNAFRVGNFSLDKGHEVKVFLIGKGVEYKEINSEQFNTHEQAEKFLSLGGMIFACGTCLKFRHKDSSSICPLSTMQDLMKIIEQSDKLVTF